MLIIHSLNLDVISKIVVVVEEVVVVVLIVVVRDNDDVEPFFM